MIIETPRLIMRLLNGSDVDMVLALLNEDAFIKNIGDKHVRTHDDALNYINNGPLAMQRELGYCLYCCVKKDDGQAIGLSGLIKREGITHPEVGFAFLSSYCQQGYGFESTQAVIDYAYSNLAINHLQAIANPDNATSIKLLTRLGFSINKKIMISINPREDDEEVILFDRISKLM